MQQIPDIDLKIKAIPIQTQTHKLKAKWSPSLSQDVLDYMDFGYSSQSKFKMSEYLFSSGNSPLGENLSFYENNNELSKV